MVSVFAPDVARSLDGPEWLREWRRGAAERVAASSLPTADEEVWRYSRIGDLAIDRFHLSDGAAVDARKSCRRCRRCSTPMPTPPRVVVVHNGRVVHVDRNPSRGGSTSVRWPAIAVVTSCSARRRRPPPMSSPR